MFFEHQPRRASPPTPSPANQAFVGQRLHFKHGFVCETNDNNTCKVTFFAAAHGTFYILPVLFTRATSGLSFTLQSVRNKSGPQTLRGTESCVQVTDAALQTVKLLSGPDRRNYLVIGAWTYRGTKQSCRSIVIRSAVV